MSLICMRQTIAADVGTSNLRRRHLFEDAPMRDSLESHDFRRWFVSEPDPHEDAPVVCCTCGGDLSLHQPDPEMPERILGTCCDCKAWYLLDGDLGCVQIAPGTMNPGEVNIGNPSLVM